MKPSLFTQVLTALATLAIVACDGGGNDPVMDGPDTGINTPDSGGTETVPPPSHYAFDSSAFSAGESSVSYGGQILRHILISDLTRTIGGLTEQIDSATFPGTGLPTEEGEVVALLDFFYRFDGDTSGSQRMLMGSLSPSMQMMQVTYNDISSGKDLVSKTAGNDDSTDHRNWTGGDFHGWSDASIAAAGGGTDSPEALIGAFFETIEAHALGRAAGTLRYGVDGEGTQLEGAENALPVHVSERGLDLQQLVQKFLLVAVTYSQGTDDYLDDDVDGKGLLASNAEQDDDSPFSVLEHHWDEGFGYFGAARDYADYTDDEIAGKGGRPEYENGWHDSNDDGAIDLLSEFNFGNSVNAAKRDRGSAEGAPTDFTADAINAWIGGRHILSQAQGRELTTEERDALMAHRDAAVRAWEDAVASTVVHYINETLHMMSTFGTEEYDFLDHAKGWSELKGFSLGLQFNPRTRLSAAQFDQFQDLIGDAPALPGSDAVETYAAALREARDILGDAYGFDAANLGDASGQNGW